MKFNLWTLALVRLNVISMASVVGAICPEMIFW